MKIHFLLLSTRLYWERLLQETINDPTFWELALCNCLLPSATSMFSYPGLPRIARSTQISVISFFLSSVARYSSHISGFRVRSGWNEYEYNWISNLIRNVVLAPNLLWEIKHVEKYFSTPTEIMAKFAYLF